MQLNREGKPGLIEVSGDEFFFSVSRLICAGLLLCLLPGLPTPAVTTILLVVSSLRSFSVEEFSCKSGYP
jgi:hypothetical protein